MNFQDVASIVIAWLFGMFTQSMTNDSKARILCRRDLLELENNLNELALQQRNINRTKNDDANKIKKIHKIIRVIEVNQAELSIKNPDLKKVIDESAKRIVDWNKNFDAPQNIPPYVGVDLLLLWGEGEGRNYEAKKIKEIRSWFDKGIIKRWIYSKWIN